MFKNEKLDTESAEMCQPVNEIVEVKETTEIEESNVYQKKEGNENIEIAEYIICPKKEKDIEMDWMSEAVSIEELSEAESDKMDWMTLVANQFGELRVVLKKGFMFGEVALTENKPRAATIITMTNTKLIIIKKEQFDIIKKINLQEKQIKREFLYQIMPKLNEINATKYMEDLLNSVETISFSKNTSLTVQQEEGDKVYFLKSGIVKVFYKLKSGKVINTSELGPGAVIGEECLFDEHGLYKYSTKVYSLEVKLLT